MFLMAGLILGEWTVRVAQAVAAGDGVHGASGPWRRVAAGHEARHPPAHARDHQLRQADRRRCQVPRIGSCLLAPCQAYIDMPV